MAPVVMEVRGPQWPSAAAWWVLRAPFELLAWPDGGFLAGDELTRFGVVRRLGPVSRLAGLDGFRLGLAFMASSPVGQHELDFEAEEMAILDAVGDARVDLLVEDTGDPEQLGERLSGAGLPVVHLSCHGVNAWPGKGGEPVLLMEDETGGARPTTAAELVGLLPGSTRLVFVSACLTATGADASAHLPAGGGRKAGTGPEGRDGLLAHSLSTGLVTAGIPAVIGWDGSVEDRAATLFAGRLYRALADRVDLAVAVGDARRALLGSEDPVVRADWHMARLWLGPAGGGPVVAGGRKRSLVSAVHGTKRFLDHKQQVPVAKAQMFVGRREELRRALRALRNGDRAGVLLHGQGRLGKSSLAARIADRVAGDYSTAVVFGDYGALAVLDAVRDAVRTNQAARDLIDSRLPEVRDRPEAISEVLVDLLSGPCAQADDGRKPLLLVVDDLEQILVPDPAGPHRVAPEHALVLAAVLRAFDPAETDSRLLLTSRFTFTLDGAQATLDHIHLRPLSTVAQRKLHRRQQALAPADRQAERARLAHRAVAVSRGNPGLQDLTCLRLAYNEQVPLSRVQAAVAGMEDYLSRGDLPADGEVREFLENLALDTLLDEAGTTDHALLRAVTLFDLPVPEPVVDRVADHVGGSPTRLRGLGLLEPYPDPVERGRTALATNPLAAGRIPPLTPAERSALADVTVDALLTAWTPDTASGFRTGEQELQLTRLALLADNPTVTAVCAFGAVRHLRTGPAADAAALGYDAIGLLDRHQRPMPIPLLRATADAALTSGEGPAGHALLDRAAHQATTEDHDDPLERARVLTEQARRLITTGEPHQAEQLLHQARHLFITEGSELEAAAVTGTIGDIAEQRGHYDEALRIRREIQLPVYERLGDTRAAAITWGRIGDIVERRGDYDEALRIRREVELPVYERLGDTRSAAITWGQIGDILYQRGDYDEALRIRREVELPVYERLGDTRSAAVTWGRIGDILYQRGDYDEALRIRREVELPVYERLGDTRS
ncbi:CHAT domain-containing protein, partial [Actinosynnema sp. NPDC050801]